MIAISRALIAGAALALVAGTLAGCTAGSDPKPTATPKPTTSEAPATVTDIDDTPGSGKGLEGAIDDSKVSTCELADGKWKVAGTVKNSTDSAADYRIYISLLTAKNETRALVQVDAKDVAPDDTAKWDKSIKLTEKGLSCVLRVERYKA